jgi:hypothetical protein
MTYIRQLVVAALLAGGMLGTVSGQSPTPAPAPGTWQALPNSRLDQAKRADGTPLLPNPLPAGSESGLGVFSYSGATLDERRGQIILVRTGGHADWAGNQVIAFDIPSAKWVLLEDYSRAYPKYSGPPCKRGPDGAFVDPPTPPRCSQVTEPAVDQYRDGSPASLHTYGNQAYMPPVDAVLSAGGLRWWDAEPANQTWWWAHGKGWISKPSRRPGGYSGIMIWDPTAKLVWYRSAAAFASYDPTADSWRVHFQMRAGADHTESSAFALDKEGQKLYRFSRKPAGGPWGVRVIDLKSPSTRETTIETTGDTQVETIKGAGLVWDPALPGLVAYGKSANGQKGALYTLDLRETPAVWRRHDPPNDVHPPPPHSTGTWGRFARYGGRYYITTSPLQDVWVFTPPWGTPAPPRAARPRPYAALSGAADAEQAPATDTASPPAKGAEPLPANTWVPIPQPPPGKAPLARGGKHARGAYDTRRGRLLITGGDRDGSDGGNGSVWSANLADGTAEELSPMCRPAPELMPNFPDNVVWAYDTKRDQALLLRGYFFAQARGMTVCKRDDHQIVRQDLVFDVESRTWQPAPWPVSPLGPGSDSAGPTFGVYDEITDSLYAYKWDGAWGGNMLILHRDSNTWERVRFSGKRERSAYCLRSQPALEPGKALYMSCLSKGPVLIRFDLKSKSATALDMPEDYKAPTTDQETYMVFDPNARVVLHPFTPNLAGVMTTLYIYDVETKKWSERPVPTEMSPRVFGNLAAWDPQSGALVLYGGHSTTIAPGVRLLIAPVTWRYRYVKE